MSKVIIIVNAQVNQGRIKPTAPVAEKMATAMKTGIIDADNSHEVEIMGASDLWAKSVKLPVYSQDLIYCPLTIKLPDWFNFSASRVYQACNDLDNRRNWVKEHFGYQTCNDYSSLGDLWLPIVMNPNQTIYGDIIAEAEIPNSYRQVFSFPHRMLNYLYPLAHELLKSIKATPAVYLLQFKIIEQKIIFDRLWPFPATPALASVKSNSETDLFHHHWHCISHQFAQI